MDKPSQATEDGEAATGGGEAATGGGEEGSPLLVILSSATESTAESSVAESTDISMCETVREKGAPEKTSYRCIYTKRMHLWTTLI
jgi:hypothetical protein